MLSLRSRLGRRLPALLIVVLLLPVGSFAGETLVIAGTGDSQQILRQLASAFEKRNPGTRIEVPDSVGSSGGVRTLLKGKADLARIARPLKPREKEQGPGLKERTFARSPVVFSANLPSPCVDTLTAEQVVGVFSGTIDNWAQLGSCPDHKIYIAQREEGDSSRSVLEKHLPGFKEIARPAGQIVYSTPETVATLVSTRFAIGYLPQAMVNGTSLVRFAYQGVAPGEKEVASGNYRLVTPLALAWNGELSGLAKRFVEFTASPQANKILRSSGLVPVAVGD